MMGVFMHFHNYFLLPRAACAKCLFYRRGGLVIRADNLGKQDAERTTSYACKW